MSKSPLRLPFSVAWSKDILPGADAAPKINPKLHPANVRIARIDDLSGRTKAYDLLGAVMARSRDKTVLFLCTGNYYRSRFAEILFNSVAERMRLPWKAFSRGLNLKPGVNVGAIAVSVVRLLETKRLLVGDAVAREPRQVELDDFESADFIVALKQAEHLPLLHERFSAWTEKVEFWNVDDAPEALALIEREVMDLTARLIGGGKRREPVQEGFNVQVAHATKTNSAVVKVGRETKGRRGKGVTTVFDVPLDDAGVQKLAATLKQRCGTGGTVKDGRIEIQGDQRERLIAVLEDMGYLVKRVGG